MVLLVLVPFPQLVAICPALLVQRPSRCISLLPLPVPCLHSATTTTHTQALPQAPSPHQEAITMEATATHPAHQERL